MKKRRLWLWITIPAVVVVVLIAALVVAAVLLVPGVGVEMGNGKSKGSRWSPFGGRSNAKGVRVFEVRRGSVISTVSAPGVVTPAREVAISSRLAGRILEIYADEGHAVKEGQIIAKLETKEFEIALERARSDLEVAQARLVEARASLKQAKVSVTRSRAELERKEALHEKGAVSDSDIDLARNQADSDRLRETVANKNIRETEEAARAAQLALEKTERDFDETDIRTPLEGIITARNVNVGERVILGIAGDPSAALFVVSDLSEILVYANVDESDVAKLAPDQPVTITTEAMKDKEFEGRIIDVAPRARRTGEISTFRTRVLVEGDIADLRPGMSAQVEIEVERADDAIIVPIEAGVERDKEEEEDEEDPGLEGEKPPKRRKKRKKEYVELVFRVEDGKAMRTEVKTGISDNTHIVVLMGIAEGDEIVAGPYRVLDKLKDEDAVNVTGTRETDSGEKKQPDEVTPEKEPGGEPGAAGERAEARPPEDPGEETPSDTEGTTAKPEQDS